MRALSAHLVLDGHPSLEDAQVVAEAVKREVHHRFSIDHATLELECEVCEVDPVCAADPSRP
jgi:Co/Zn/Cd efflux system component